MLMIRALFVAMVAGGALVLGGCSYAYDGAWGPPACFDPMAASCARSGCGSCGMPWVAECAPPCKPAPVKLW
jgi:hypothetical protein